MLALIETEPLPSFALGDVPSSPLEVQVDTDHTWTGVECPLADLHGLTLALVPEADPTTVRITVDQFRDAGTMSWPLVLTDGSGKRESVEAVLVIVEDPADGWHTLATARREWDDAPDSDVTLYELLDVARVACLSFAPSIDPAPTHYRKGQLMQARAIWTASRATNGDRMGDENFGVTVFPLDWNVKQTLRPKRAVGGMF